MLNSIAVGGHPSFWKIARLNLTYILPASLLRLANFSTKEKRWVNQTRSIMREVAGKLLDEQWSVESEKEGEVRNAMSLLGNLQLLCLDWLLIL